MAILQVDDPIYINRGQDDPIELDEVTVIAPKHGTSNMSSVNINNKYDIDEIELSDSYNGDLNKIYALIQSGYNLFSNTPNARQWRNLLRSNKKYGDNLFRLAYSKLPKTFYSNSSGSITDVINPLVRDYVVTADSNAFKMLPLNIQQEVFNGNIHKATKNASQSLLKLSSLIPFSNPTGVANIGSKALGLSNYVFRPVSGVAKLSDKLIKSASKLGGKYTQEIYDFVAPDIKTLLSPYINIGNGVTDLYWGAEGLKHLVGDDGIKKTKELTRKDGILSYPTIHSALGDGLDVLGLVGAGVGLKQLYNGTKNSFIGSNINNFLDKYSPYRSHVYKKTPALNYKPINDREIRNPYELKSSIDFYDGNINKANISYFPTEFAPLSYDRQIFKNIWDQKSFDRKGKVFKDQVERDEEYLNKERKSISNYYHNIVKPNIIPDYINISNNINNKIISQDIKNIIKRDSYKNAIQDFYDKRSEYDRHKMHLKTTPSERRFNHYSKGYLELDIPKLEQRQFSSETKKYKIGNQTSDASIGYYTPGLSITEQPIQNTDNPRLFSLYYTTFPNAVQKSNNIQSQIANHINFIDNTLSGNGFVVGSARQAASGFYNGLPNDLEILTTKSRYPQVAKLLGFKKDGTNGLGHPKGIVSNEYGLNNNEADIDLIETNNDGFAIGKVAHQIAEAIFPKEMAQYYESQSRKASDIGLHLIGINPYKKIPDKYNTEKLPIPKFNKDGSIGGFFTDEELFSLLKKDDNLLRYEIERNLLSSEQPKHTQRQLSIMSNIHNNPELLMRVNNFVNNRKYFVNSGNYHKATDIYPIDFNDTKSNYDFLVNIGIPQNDAKFISTSPEEVQAILEAWYLNKTSLKAGRKIVTGNTYDPYTGKLIEKDLGMLDMEHGNKDFSRIHGSGMGKNYSIWPFGGGGLHTAYNNSTGTVAIQMPMSLYPEKIKTANDLFKQYEHLQNFHKTENLNSQDVEKFLMDYNVGNIRRISPGNSSYFILPEELQHKFAQKFDLPFVVSEGLDNTYAGKMTSTQSYPSVVIGDNYGIETGNFYNTTPNREEKFEFAPSSNLKELLLPSGHKIPIKKIHPSKLIPNKKFVDQAIADTKKSFEDDAYFDWVDNMGIDGRNSLSIFRSSPEYNNYLNNAISETFKNGIDVKHGDQILHINPLTGSFMKVGSYVKKPKLSSPRTDAAKELRDYKKVNENRKRFNKNELLNLDIKYKGNYNHEKDLRDISSISTNKDWNMRKNFKTIKELTPVAPILPGLVYGVNYLINEADNNYVDYYYNQGYRTAESAWNQVVKEAIDAKYTKEEMNELMKDKDEFIKLFNKRLKTIKAKGKGGLIKKINI